MGNTIVQSEDGKWQQSRAHRFNTPNLRCPYGQLLDMSATGMRFRLDSKPDFAIGDLRELHVQGPTQKLKVTVRVAWIKKPLLGFGKAVECGVQFVIDKPGLDKVLAHFAEHGFVPKDGFKGSKTQTPKQPMAVNVQVPDLYAMLGLKFGASDEDIHGAYRDLAKKLHPDANPNGDTMDQFSAVTKAYSVLKDATLKKQYDERFRAMLKQQAAEAKTDAA